MKTRMSLIEQDNDLKTLQRKIGRLKEIAELLK